jgi:dienelactone hydrolase
VTQSGATITLSSTISTPSGDGPFPVVIGMNTPTGSLPSSIFTGSGVATMSFTSSVLVPDAFNVTRGAGSYFTMYPDTNAGAMIEWAWGVSRLIDGLYKTADQHKLDLKRIAVTGCSYQGKMSLYAGAFDERIALVMPQESGGGGEASWRFMATQTGTEDLEAAQGTAWYAQNLKQFKNADAPKLPVDMHELVAMVAPRAILIIANTAIDRLGSQAGYTSMKAAAEVYEALGIPDRIGFTQTAASNHCSFPSSQTADVQAFVDKFLRGMTSANTAIAKSPYSTDLTKWITWTTPELE